MVGRNSLRRDDGKTPLSSAAPSGGGLERGNPVADLDSPPAV